MFFKKTFCHVLNKPCDCPFSRSLGNSAGTSAASDERYLQHVQPGRLSPAAGLHVRGALPGGDETRAVPESEEDGVPDGRFRCGVGLHLLLLSRDRYVSGVESLSSHHV